MANRNLEGYENIDMVAPDSATSELVETTETEMTDIREISVFVVKTDEAE